jgi:hypothetical protein
MSRQLSDPNFGLSDAQESKGVFVPGLAQLEAGGSSAVPAIAKRSATMQYVLLGGVLLAGVGVLVFLRTQGLGADLVLGNEPKIDYPIDAPTNVKAEQRQRQVMADLASSDDLVQVPSENIEQNPFRLAEITRDEAAEAADTGAAPLQTRTGPTPEELRLAELDRHAASLQLNTVISGRISLARINGRTYRVGDTVEDVFRITEITAERTVALEADGHEYVLEMASN